MRSFIDKSVSEKAQVSGENGEGVACGRRSNSFQKRSVGLRSFIFRPFTFSHTNQVFKRVCFGDGSIVMLKQVRAFEFKQGRSTQLRNTVWRGRVSKYFWSHRAPHYIKHTLLSEPEPYSCSICFPVFFFSQSIEIKTRIRITLQVSVKGSILMLPLYSGRGLLEV